MRGCATCARSHATSYAGNKTAAPRPGVSLGHYRKQYGFVPYVWFRHTARNVLGCHTLTPYVLIRRAKDILTGIDGHTCKPSLCLALHPKFPQTLICLDKRILRRAFCHRASCRYKRHTRKSMAACSCTRRSMCTSRVFFSAVGIPHSLGVR